MKSLGRMIATSAVASSIVMSSNAAAAPAAPIAPQQQSAWLALSAMTPAGAAALGTAGVAAQPTYDDRNGYGGPTVGPVPLPVILIFIAVLALDIYLLTRGHHDHEALVPNSPG